MKKPIITIDGPAGAGKSTVSRELAKQLSLRYLDTGALYRAVACAARDKGIAPDDEKSLADLCSKIDVSLIETGEGIRTVINKRDRTECIRSPEISLLASKVSAIPAVRAYLLIVQRRLGEGGGIVAEGRDMGTVVFPHADFKFFLGAAVEERARRRHRELAERGIAADMEDVRNDMITRDHEDSERKIAPLMIPADAVVVDTTNLTVSQVVVKMVTIVSSGGEDRKSVV